MQFYLEKKKFLKFLRLVEVLKLDVSYNSISLYGLSPKNILSFYKEDKDDFEVIKECSFIIDKEWLDYLESYLKQAVKEDFVIFSQEDGMPELNIKSSTSSISVPLSLDPDLEERFNKMLTINSDFDKGIVVKRDFIEMLKRVNYFVDSKSELKSARYISIDIHDTQEDLKIKSIGFSGIAGYEEKAILPKNNTDLLPMEHMANIINSNNEYKDIKLTFYVHSHTIDDLYRFRTAIDKDNIVVGYLKNKEYIYIKDSNFVLYIKNDNIKPINFEQLFNHQYDVSNIPFYRKPFDGILKSIPGIGRKDSVIKFDTNKEYNSLHLISNVINFKIGELPENDIVNSLYFQGRAIDRLFKNIKKINVEEFNLSFNNKNKLIFSKGISKDNVYSYRFLSIGLLYNNDKEAFS